MKQFSADFSQFALLDGSRLPRPRSLPPPAPHRTLSPNERSSLKSALSFGQMFTPGLSPMKEIVDVGESPPPVTVRRPARMPAGFAFSSSLELTLAGGLTVSAFAGIGVVVSGGIYGSTTREVGVFLTSGGGLFSAFGASAGVEIDYIFGTPVDLSGTYVTVSVAVSGPSFIGASGSLLFSPTPSALVLMGFAISCTANTPFPIPVTVSAVVTDTKVWPMLRF